jgi:hypothetical protein
MSFNNSNGFAITVPGIYNMFDNNMKKIGYLVSDPHSSLKNHDDYFIYSVNRAYLSITRFITITNTRLRKKEDLSHSERNDFKSMMNRMIKLKQFFEQYFDKIIQKI